MEGVRYETFHYHFLSMMLTTAAVAGQITQGSWDFDGVECSPGSMEGWAFECIGGDGVTILDITYWDWDQYDILYEGGGMMLFTLDGCGEVDLGAQFEVIAINDALLHYLPEVFDVPATFCYYCDGPYEVVPTRFALADAYPNPFNPTTIIDYSISEPCHATLTVFNVTGQEVVTLVDGELEVGNFNVTFDATDLASGVYFYKLNAGDFSAVRKMTLVK